MDRLQLELGVYILPVLDPRSELRYVHILDTKWFLRTLHPAVLRNQSRPTIFRVRLHHDAQRKLLQVWELRRDERM
jgi:hypothetical protein